MLLANQASEKASKPKYKPKYVATQLNRAATIQHSDGAMVVSHSLSATSKKNCIIDSGATCHKCNDKQFFRELAR